MELCETVWLWVALWGSIVTKKDLRESVVTSRPVWSSVDDAASRDSILPYG